MGPREQDREARLIKRKIGIVIVVLCLAAGLALLGYALLSDSLRFSDFAVVLKNRTRGENTEPPRTSEIPETPAGEAEDGKPAGNPGDPTEPTADPGSSGGQDGGETPSPQEVIASPRPTDGPASTPTPGGRPAQSAGPAETEPPPTVTREELLARCDRELEEMWAYYTERVQAMEQEARSEYRALPEEERTKQKKEEIVSAKTDLLYALEDECDARVNALLTEIGAELRKLGEDTSVISVYRKEYADRKHAMESDYLQRFQQSVA